MHEKGDEAMTRFEKELSGAFGTFWKKNAEMEIERFQTMADQGEIILDADGAAKWKINKKYLPCDCAEKLSYTSFSFNLAATVKKREQMDFLPTRHWAPTAEEIAEMTTVFGSGTTVVNIINGEQIKV